jgi:hypothetical protein
VPECCSQREEAALGVHRRLHSEFANKPAAANALRKPAVAAVFQNQLPYQPIDFMVQEPTSTR